MGKIFHSENYLGSNKKNYFEGWYFRHLGTYPVSFIVGISHNESDRHCFIQYIDRERSAYFKFEPEAFSFDREDMTIRVRGNTFSTKGICVQLCGEKGEIAADIRYGQIDPLKKTLLFPSVMGPFGYLPLPCTHSVISMSHTAAGTLRVGGAEKTVDGIGYIEKDFGSKFPANYFWMHAASRDISIVTAVARPVVLGLRGHICIVKYKDKVTNFSLYAAGKIHTLTAGNDGVCFDVGRGKSRLSFTVENDECAQSLIAPDAKGAMTVSIRENLAAPFCGSLTLDGASFDLSELKTCAFEVVLKDRKL